ncbi:MAG: 4-hydroxy-tetrahydrodipicolinate reductase [Deltaproteobacteria bacterium]|nr:4-hydroxy-tetrahydrodipicolinate reductase [Deltaproteobacteria bacterium]
MIAGATGRFVQLLQEVVKADPFVHIVGLASLEQPLQTCVQTGAVVIDFTAPEAAALHAKLAAENGMPMVIATTGLGEAELAVVHEAAHTVPIVLTPNTSVAVTVLARALRRIAPALGAGYRVAMEETHHVHKKDAPSGTALRLRRIIAEALHTPEETIPIEAHREGDVIGTHTITFRGPSDRLTITHEATDRRLFCEGALRAAKGVAAKPAGLYTMENVLNGPR